MERDLIDAYLAALRVRLRWRPDVEDVVDEVADHLRERAERLAATGVPQHEAQRLTLECFGDLGLVARSFAQTPSGQLAVPTPATRLAGAVALGAGAAWAVAAVVAAAGAHTDLLTVWTLRRYQQWVLVLAIAVALTTLAVTGVLLRAGRARTPTSAAVVVVGMVTVAVVFRFGWLVTPAMSVLGVAVLQATRGHAGDAERFLRPLRSLGAAWPLGAAAVLLFDEILPMGPADRYGDHPVAWLVPFLACALCSVAGLVLAGARLCRERVADLDDVTGTPAGHLTA